MRADDIARLVADWPSEDAAQLVHDLRDLAGDGWVCASAAADLIEPLLQLARAVSEAPRLELSMRNCLIDFDLDPNLAGQTVALVPVKKGE